MKGSFTPMPIPFLEALRGRLAPVFNGTVPLERKKEIITNGAWLACQGLDSTAGTNTRALHKYLQIFASTFFYFSSLQTTYSTWLQSGGVTS